MLTTFNNNALKKRWSHRAVKMSNIRIRYSNDRGSLKNWPNLSKIPDEFKLSAVNC